MPTTMATIDQTGMPPEFRAHHSFTIEREVIRSGYLDYPQLEPGGAWATCSCGWTSAPPDPYRDDGRPILLSWHEAYMGWARHLPAGFLAWTLARKRWTDEVLTSTGARVIGHVIPPDGWDAPGGHYDWRAAETTITEKGWSVKLPTTDRGPER